MLKHLNLVHHQLWERATFHEAVIIHHLRGGIARAHPCHAVRQLAYNLHEFHPGRDSADGTATCSHCQQVLRRHYGLRIHIESGCCKAYNPIRPLGNYVPYTWQALKDLVLNHDADQILLNNDYMMALKACCVRCVLCGRQTRKPGSIFQRMLQDHKHLLDLCKARRQVPE